MLLEFGLKNYFSFKEWGTISFRLDANCPPEISQGLSFTPVLCVKGANASGKTNILQGLSFIAKFATTSFLTEPESLIPLDAFFDSDEPSEFFAEFSVDETTYRYEVVATDREVKRETIYRTQVKKTKLVERINNELPVCTKSLESLKAIKLRKNASIIATANQYELNGLGKLYNFFRSVISNVTYGGAHVSNSVDATAKILVRHDKYLSFVKTFIKECDVGIADIKIVKYSKLDGVTKYAPEFIHLADGKMHKISGVTESSGTKTLFINLLEYKIVLDSGGVLVLDEFDMYLHPHILPKLLELFITPELNPKRAQLIFSTHNSDVLNTLGRYRIYLVNKIDNESFAYRLDEIPGDVLRNDRPILPAYNDGKIGGIPKL